ncbi:histidine kinase [Hyphococcus flavus]|uniref:Histidine kinase n=1 Tax=Hyphococcus flavus TaxID=1866326 RepID=A0AAE9ZA19_9PROT|nr:histidine kinase [Hyphococcus flavus]WDI30199.1 histidine kinase [Hyphococcus flavus]
MTWLRAFIVSFFCLVGVSETQAKTFHVFTSSLVSETDTSIFADPGFDDSNWEEVSLDRFDPQGKVMWFRARVDGRDLMQLNETHPLGLFLFALASREVYFNGEKIGATGSPGPTKAEETAGAVDAVYFIPERLIEPGENVIAVRISSHHLPSRVMAPFHAMFITAYQQPNALIKQAYLPAIFAGGAIGLGAFYFLGLFTLNRRDYASLSLSILALAIIGQLSAEAWRAFHLYDYPLHMLRLWLVLGFALIAGAALSVFAAHLFAPKNLRLVFGIGAGLALVSVFLPGYDSKTVFVILSFALAALIASAIGARSQRKGAVITGLAIVFFFVVFLADPWNFLDVNYYLMMAALVFALFILQIRNLTHERIKKEEAALQAIRLRHELLRKQIQPHFMMNTLTALAEWIEQDPKTGVAMIDALSQEMRLLYDHSEKALIPLEEELALCRHHLKVMSLRADANFSLLTSGHTKDLTCPPAIILTLIENAFTHNEYRSGAVFEIHTNRDQHRVCVQCLTPIAETAASCSHTGAGLAYVKARLTEAFADRWEMHSARDGAHWKTETSWQDS